MKQFHPFRKIIVDNAGISTPKSICPVATSSCLFLLIFSLTSFSCKKTPHGQTPPSAAEVAAAEPADSLPGQVDLPSGISVMDAGRRLSPDSFPQPEIVPLKSIPKVITAHPNRRVAGPPKVVEIPAELTVITPGENGAPLPETKPVKGKIVTALQQKPVVVPPFRSKEDAFENIYYLENDLGRRSDQMEAIYEDSRGFLWLGSSAGAIRYDGTAMTLYSEKQGMSANMIRAIVEDQKGQLWFATFGGGATCYDGTRFIHFTENEGMSSNGIYSMIVDRKGNLWFGTFGGGVIRYDGSNLTIFTVKQGLSDQSVYSMMEDSKGNLWFGTVKGGACRFDGKSFTHFTVKEGLCSNLVYSITEDRNGNIWFGTYKGASRFDGQRFTNFTEEQGLIGNFVKSIHEDQKGNIWIANSNGSSVVEAGVSRFDGQYFTNFTKKEGLGHNFIRNIRGDKKGNIWLATSKGITRIRPESFNHFSALNGLDFEQMVSTILWDKKGDLWLGTWVGGLIRFDGENFTYFGSETGLKSTVVNRILMDKDGTLWLDAGKRGASTFDGKTFEHYWVGVNDLLNLLLIDSEQNVWFSVTGGVIKKKGDSLTIFDKKEIFGEDFIENMLEDNQGNLWFGSASGAIKYDGKAFIRFTEKEGLSSNSISAIFEDSQGKIWFGTGDEGLNMYDGNRFTHISEKDGLGNNAIYDITEDSSGNIWVGRYHGISVLSPVKTWPVALKHKPEAPTLMPLGDYFIANFDTEDGLQGKNFLVTYLDQKNYLWLGNESGLTKLNLTAFGKNIDPPLVYLEHLEIGQQFIDYRKLSDTAYQHSISFGKEVGPLSEPVVPFYNYPEKLILPYELNHLTFHFSSPNLEVPHKIQYSYIIEGVDKDWSRPQPEPKAEYRNLPSGTLTIKVRAVRDGQIWSEPFSYTFTIQPPWYRHWLAYLIYALAGAGLLFALRRYELNRQLARSEARRLKELNQVKNRLYTNITHEFRTPLTVINGMANRLQGQVDYAARESLKLIQRNGSQLLNLVNQMLDLAKLENGNLPVNMAQGDVVVFLKYLLESFHSLAESKSIALLFEADREEFFMDFDAERLRQIVSNLLSNAVKFTPPGGAVRLGVRLNPSSAAELGFGVRLNPSSAAELGFGDTMTLTVTDTGKGIPPEKLPFIFDRFYQADDSSTRHTEGTGIGLTLARELVKLLGGSIEVQSEWSKGTTFIVRLPVTCNAPLAVTPVFENDPPGLAPGVHFSEEKKSSDPHRPSLLLVEDNDDVRRYVQDILKNEYSVEVAQNGKAGLEKALARLPDLILSDVMMPEMDGYDLLRTLKNDLRTSHIPVVLLTAKADFDSRIEGLELGADAYLAKPFDEKELKVVLKKLNESRERLRQFYTSGMFLEKNQTGTEPDVQLPAKDAEFLKCFREVIELRFSDPDFTAEQLSQQMLVSYTTCLRKVKALTGMTINECIRHFRLHRAAQWLLDDPGRPVTSIAEAAGYSSHTYFDRDFKKIMGCTPTEYRLSRGKP